jgi:hypothetical protein
MKLLHIYCWVHLIRLCSLEYMGAKKQWQKTEGDTRMDQHVGCGPWRFSNKGHLNAPKSSSMPVCQTLESPCPFWEMLNHLLENHKHTGTSNSFILQLISSMFKRLNHQSSISSISEVSETLAKHPIDLHLQARRSNLGHTSMIVDACWYRNICINKIK